jgi:hypothetical protein
MPDSEVKRSAALTNILGDEKGGRGHSSAGAGEQAFSLRTDFRDGRRKRGMSWSHYSDYEWLDWGDHETLEVLFGEKILTVQGHNLKVLYRLIDEGKLKAFEEELNARVKQLRDNPPENEALVTSIEIYPDFEQLKQQIRGEENVQTRFTRRMER